LEYVNFYNWDKKEKEWIKKMKSHISKGGYNITFGGKGFTNIKYNENNLDDFVLKCLIDTLIRKIKYLEKELQYKCNEYNYEKNKIIIIR
jgi:hypothetical protein